MGLWSEDRALVTRYKAHFTILGSFNKIEVSFNKIEVSFNKIEVSFNTIEVSFHRLQGSLHKLYCSFRQIYYNMLGCSSLSFQKKITERSHATSPQRPERAL